MATKPIKRILDWASGGTQTDPGGAKEATGWILNERVPFTWLNWIFASYGEWLSWAETSIDIGCPTLVAQVYVNGGVVTTNPNAENVFSASRSGNSIQVFPSGGISAPLDTFPMVSVQSTEGGVAAIPRVGIVAGAEGVAILAVSFQDAAGATIDLSTTDIDFSITCIYT